MVCRNDLRFILFIFPAWGMEAGCVCVCVVCCSPRSFSHSLNRCFSGPELAPLQAAHQLETHAQRSPHRRGLPDVTSLVAEPG